MDQNKPSFIYIKFERKRKDASNSFSQTNFHCTFIRRVIYTTKIIKCLFMYITQILKLLDLVLPLHRKSSVEDTCNWLEILSNLSDRKKLWHPFNVRKTPTSAVNIAFTGLWSDNFDVPRPYSCCFNPFPAQIIRSHLKDTKNELIIMNLISDLQINYI